MFERGGNERATDLVLHYRAQGGNEITNQIRAGVRIGQFSGERQTALGQCGDEKKGTRGEQTYYGRLE